jgi:selenide, water dikinase
MDASVLAQVLRDLPPITDPNVLVDSSTADDAGVYLLSPDCALVQTVDFFTPIVDDPRDYGRIAAANALSDVYAMGGRPLCALAVAAFPEEMDAAVIGQILAGGAEKAAEAGISIIGGHTIKDDEPKYGLSVTGIVDPERIWRNDTGRPGDVLILTKALGTGVLTTAHRRDRVEPKDLEAAVASMSALNRAAAETLRTFDVSAATDVTGFGLIGHVLEMTAGRIGAQIDAQVVPLLHGAIELASHDCVPGGSYANLRNALARGVRFADDLSQALRVLLCDAQTSGGLLAAVRREEAVGAVRALRENGMAVAAAVGRFTAEAGVTVE